MLQENWSVADVEEWRNMTGGGVNDTLAEDNWVRKMRAKSRYKEAREHLQN